MPFAARPGLQGALRVATGWLLIGYLKQGYFDPIDPPLPGSAAREPGLNFPDQRGGFCLRQAA